MTQKAPPRYPSIRCTLESVLDINGRGDIQYRLPYTLLQSGGKRFSFFDNFVANFQRFEAWIRRAGMKDFAAIDFETANGRRTSVCSVGIVTVREGEVIDRIYRLIRPRPNYYSDFCSRIHGLTYHDTIEAPHFPEIWEEITPHIAGLPLVDHNSPFDEGCLKAAFGLYGLPYPGYEFYCTYRASRRTFGRALPDHRLPTVASACGYNLREHHHALADAEACAAIALKIL